MAPLSFAKLFSQRSSSRSARSDSERRPSVDSYSSAESYAIFLPSIYPASEATLPSPVTSTASSDNTHTAEMIDDDNFAWGRPSRARRQRGGSRA